MNTTVNLVEHIRQGLPDACDDAGHHLLEVLIVPQLTQLLHHELQSFLGGGGLIIEAAIKKGRRAHASLLHLFDDGGATLVGRQAAADAPVAFYLRSDASKEGARLPGLGGALGGTLWRYPNNASLAREELALPIGVLEFAAYYGTVEVFGDTVDSDALVVPAFARRAAPRAHAHSCAGLLSGRLGDLSHTALPA
ncbi:hypothetical protein AB1Y20_014703 [Prymnesium parvum]|uniref:Uncharacterized protein n=1 Tax=Prymnesium parvum TaxID=97485 RepID=A0AB34IBK8_PRYPA